MGSGLFFDTQHPVSLKMGHTEPLRILHFLQQGFSRPFSARLKRLCGLGNVTLNQIVSQHDAERTIIGKCSASRNASAIPPSPCW